jgi:flagellar biosynthetic protein FliP
LITVLSLAPGLAVMITCFPFVVTVLSILRQALGLQQAPPNMLIVSLALFLTYFVMAPVFEAAYAAGIEPLTLGTLSPEEAIPGGLCTISGTFMLNRVNPDTLRSLAELRGAEPQATRTRPSSSRPSCSARWNARFRSAS